jgi:hypothetical protein
MCTENPLAADQPGPPSASEPTKPQTPASGSHRAMSQALQAHEAPRHDAPLSIPAAKPQALKRRRPPMCQTHTLNYRAQGRGPRQPGNQPDSSSSSGSGGRGKVGQPPPRENPARPGATARPSVRPPPPANPPLVPETRVPKPIRPQPPAADGLQPSLRVRHTLPRPRGGKSVRRRFSPLKVRTAAP